MLPNTPIQFEHVFKTYSIDIHNKSTALIDLSFSVKQGEVFGIIGPNGAGKSTALNILLGFVFLDKGSVTIAGKRPNSTSCNLEVGYLAENPCLYRNLTLTEHLRFAGTVAGYSSVASRKRIEELLFQVDLAHVANKKIRHFSKGMTQRAALAYALFHKPKILILDEPMSGLDPVGRKMVIDIICDYNKAGNTVLFCSHILTDVQRICDRIGIMNKGKMDQILNSIDITDEKNLETIFIQTVSR
ncbi:ABC transporter ATP-binding protein [Desulfopila aestuarii]|uniref:ABC-2 type transport system ATP-binding protein n=1 Tax=Desulfopila aestuarii DSM 18488 TaxID=1121416 RepID=A0A1M7Y1R4_9BACT|nr:ABC transporter ATP-binding protein [Desulfopila aestuarii]SHO45733.1 ABC-2 type transport system ATP-binding protein [Desulfopila aestuarii DSM 18488]